MSQTRTHPPSPAGTTPDKGGDLVAAFEAARDELVSSLAFLLGCREAAADAAQEAFLKCWRAKESSPPVDNWRAWIFRVAFNAARDQKRSAWSRKARPLTGDVFMTASQASQPADALEHAEQLARLRSALSELRRDEQEVFLLRQNGELTYEQIAEMRACPVGTVKTQMRAALIKLRKTLVTAGEI